MKKLEKMIPRMKMVDNLFDVQRLSLLPQARLPSKFKMPKIDKFDGTRCLSTHWKMYVRTL